MERERSDVGGFSNITIAAILAALVLLGSALWRAYSPAEDMGRRQNDVPRQSEYETVQREPDAVDIGAPAQSIATTSEPIGPIIMDQMINSYAMLEQQGAYTPEIGAALGSAIASNITTDLAYTSFSLSDVKTTPDTSRAAALTYSSALHDALSPLKENSDPEFVIFAKYIETKDPAYIAELRHVADLYKSSASRAMNIVVPIDVAAYHVSIANSLEKFSSALIALANRADDPLASIALLNTYNAAEYDVATALNGLKHYYDNKAR